MESNKILVRLKTRETSYYPHANYAKTNLNKKFIMTVHGKGESSVKQSRKITRQLNI